MLSLQTLVSSYQRLLANPSASSQPKVAQLSSEIRGTLAGLGADIEDLEESVRIVENVGGQFGIDENEIQNRRSFVVDLKRDVEVGTSVHEPTNHVLNGTSKLIFCHGASFDPGDTTFGPKIGPWITLTNQRFGMSSSVYKHCSYLEVMIGI